MVNYSSQKDQILHHLKSNNIQSLWHFTNIFNLSNIVAYGGLRSKEFLEDNSFLDRIICGGNPLSLDLDKRFGNWDKISLNFTPYTPMAYHKKKEAHLVFIELDIEVATFEGVYFTDCNATRKRNGQIREKGLKGLKNVKFDLINSKPKPWDQDWHKFVQAEILVPDYIPIEYFKSIHFVSDASKETAIQFMRDMEHLIQVRPSTFEDEKRIQFPFVQNFFLSTKEVNKGNFGKVSKSAPYISAGEPFWVLVDFFATAGTKWTIRLDGGSYQQQKDANIDKADSWIWYPKFIAPDDDCYVNIEVCCNDIIWIKTVVEVRE